MTFEQIRQYIKGIINGIDFNNHISPMPAEDMNEVISPLPSVMSRRFKYSTEEQVVGEWIDGKPIYQKTFIFETNIIIGTGWTNLSIIIPNIKTCISASAVGGGTNQSSYILNSNILNNTIIQLMSARASGESTIKYLTLQYTKTTD